MTSWPEAVMRVAAAYERRDFTGVSEDDLAIADQPRANALYRDWLAGGKVPVPLNKVNDCVEEVLVAVSDVSSFDHRYRYVIGHHEPLDLQPGDLIYIRRQRRPHDPEKRR